MMKSGSKTGFASLAVIGGLGWLVVACPATLDDRCADGACVSAVAPPGEGGVMDGGGPDVVGPPPGCDEKAEPTTAPLCVVDDYAIFVAPDGKPDAAGGKTSPVNSISAALAKLGNKPRIYVCKGSYTEKVVISKPVSIYGGFECGTWNESPERPQFEAPMAGDYALQISGVTGAVLVSRLAFLAKAGTALAPSSIAAFVVNSPSVVFRGANLTARAAQPTGAAGTPGATGTLLAPTTDLNGGVPETLGVGKGGAAKTCACSSGGTSKGGRGGDLTGTVDGEAGETKITPSMPLTATGDPSTQATCNAPGLPGQTGSNAPSAADAIPAAVSGTLDADGWKPSDGPAGQAGNPGQGGGGAGSKTIGASPGGGGGGACGGCGGTGGGGGKAGGSSIAVLAFNSPVTFETSELVAAAAGKGGTGQPGGTGAAGGFGGARVGSCSGGDGGRGGDGGAGAGGSGGLSIGILHKNGAPTVDNATNAAITIGAAGAKGDGGKPMQNDGMAGDAKKVLGL